MISSPKARTKSWLHSSCALNWAQWDLRKSCTDRIGCTRHPRRREEGEEKRGGRGGGSTASRLLGGSNEKPARPLRRAPPPAGSDCSLCLVIISSIFCDGRADSEQEQGWERLPPSQPPVPISGLQNLGSSTSDLACPVSSGRTLRLANLDRNSGPTLNPFHMLKRSCLLI